MSLVSEDIATTSAFEGVTAGESDAGMVGSQVSTTSDLFQIILQDLPFLEPGIISNRKITHTTMQHHLQYHPYFIRS